MYTIAIENTTANRKEISDKTAVHKQMYRNIKIWATGTTLCTPAGYCLQE